MNLIRSPFWTPLFALDRLNSWLRSEQPWYCPARSALKPVIYWTKTQAVLAASKQWHIGMRRVMVKKKCRTCDGTGIWVSFFAPYDSEMDEEEYRWNYGQRCRRCAGKGRVVLKFIETTIGPLRWHTPAEKWASSSLDVYVPFASFAFDDDTSAYVEAEGWEPLQKGRPLPLSSAHRDMLILLRAYPNDVCFSLDFHHYARCYPYWHTPITAVAEAWLDTIFQEASLRSLK